MSFKFFRKYQKIMLWFVVILAIFTFTIFSVQSTMKTCFTQETVDDIGEYTLKDGTKLFITRTRYSEVRHALLRLMSDNYSEAMVVPHIVLYEEASRAGILVSKAELKEGIERLFGGNMISPDEYRNFIVKSVGFRSVKQFEQIQRERIAVNKFKGFHALADDLFLTQEIYEKYKVENEELKIDYLAFKADDYTDQVDAGAFEEAEIEDYYKTLRPGIGQEELTLFEKFLFDFAYVDTSSIDFEAYAELTADVTIEEREVAQYFEVVKERYKIEKPVELDAGEGDGEPAPEDDEEEGADENAPSEEPADVEPGDEYRELSEVKEELEKELKILALLDKAEKDWIDFAKESGLLEPPAPKDETETENAETESDAPDPDAFFQSLCDKYALSRKTFEDKVSWDTIETLELFGSEGFKRRVKSLRKNYTFVIKPCADCVTHVAFLVRVVERDEAKLKELSEVRDLVVEKYAQTKRMELAENAANEFKDALRAKVDDFEEVKSKVEQILTAAREEAEKRIAERKESQEDYTDEMAERYLEGTMRRAEADANRELDPFLHRVYDETCTEMGVTPVVLDYFPKSEAQNRSAPEGASEAESFIKSRMGFIVSQLVEDAFSNPLRDNDGNTFYLIHMVDRRFPDPSAMSYDDLTKGRERIEMDKMIARWQATQGAGATATPAEDDPFSNERIMKDYNVQFYRVEDSEEGAPPVEE